MEKTDPAEVRAALLAVRDWVDGDGERPSRAAVAEALRPSRIAPFTTAAVRVVVAIDDGWQFTLGALHALHALHTAAVSDRTWRVSVRRRIRNCTIRGSSDSARNDE